MARILVIDDEAQIRRVLRRSLEQNGYEVEEARDGVEGLRLYRAAPTDLVITDILMPEKEGYELIRELRAIHRGVRIIAISGGSAQIDMDTLGTAKFLGAVRTLQKPFELAAMLRTVREVLEERSAA
jgi:CheY-like chemotaxis protein